MWGKALAGKNICYQRNDALLAHLLHRSAEHACEVILGITELGTRRQGNGK